MIEIRVEDVVAKAVLLDEKAPMTSKAFFQRLPIQGEVFHAIWAGELMWTPLAIDVMPENDFTFASPGDLAYYPQGKELFIVYGRAQYRGRGGPRAANVFGSIEDNLSGIREIGKKMRREGCKKISIERCK